MFFTIFSATHSQTPIDSLVNRDKEIGANTEYLIYEYRLPDWGYKQL